MCVRERDASDVLRRGYVCSFALFSAFFLLFSVCVYLLSAPVASEGRKWLEREREKERVLSRERRVGGGGKDASSSDLERDS